MIDLPNSSKFYPLAMCSPGVFEIGTAVPHLLVELAPGDQFREDVDALLGPEDISEEARTRMDGDWAIPALKNRHNSSIDQPNRDL